MRAPAAGRRVFRVREVCAEAARGSQAPGAQRWRAKGARACKPFGGACERAASATAALRVLRADTHQLAVVERLSVHVAQVAVRQRRNGCGVVQVFLYEVGEALSEHAAPDERSGIHGSGPGGRRAAYGLFAYSIDRLSTPVFIRVHIYERLSDVLLRLPRND